MKRSKAMKGCSAAGGHALHSTPMQQRQDAYRLMAQSQHEVFGIQTAGRNTCADIAVAGRLMALYSLQTHFSRLMVMQLPGGCTTPADQTNKVAGQLGGF